MTKMESIPFLKGNGNNHQRQESQRAVITETLTGFDKNKSIKVLNQSIDTKYLYRRETAGERNGEKQRAAEMKHSIYNRTMSSLAKAPAQVDEGKA